MNTMQSSANGGSSQRPVGSELSTLTTQVAKNNHSDRAGTDQALHATLRHVRERVKHIIYVVKENRSYDQVLGNLERGAAPA